MMAKMSFSNSLKVSLLVISGVFLVISGFLCYVFLPFLVEHIVKQELILTPEAVTFQGWQRIPIPIYNRFYFFNITNPDQVLAHEEKPIVEELGPYTYREEREKVNIRWHENGTVSYQQVRRWFFVSEKTNGSLEDSIVHLNVPLVASGTEAKKLGGGFYYDTINDLLTGTNESIFQKHAIRELLFEGHTNYMMEAAQVLGFPIPQDKFGWFYGKNNSVSDGSYRVFTGQADTMDKYGLLDAWNDEHLIGLWGGFECNRLDNSSPGDFRPPYSHPNPEFVHIFVGDICRSLPLHYLREVDNKGLKTHRYWVEPKAFDYSCSNNQCYCPQRGCPANGVFNTSLCSHGSPSAVSFPHFLYADSKYSQDVRGLKPEPSMHTFYMDLEPNLGTAVKVVARLQVNIVFEKDEHLDHAANLTQDQIYYPMFWFESTTDLEDEMRDQLKVLQKVPTFIAIGAFTQLALACFILTATLIYALRLQKIEKDQKPSRNDYQAVPVNVISCTTTFDK